VTKSKQTVEGVNYGSEMEYVYNLSGALIEETYPSTRKVRNVLDADGNLALVQSKKNASGGYFNYAKSFTYTAAGAVSSMQLGNGRWESTVFNSRLQPMQIALGNVQNATNLLKLNFTYNTPNQNDNNGNVLSQTSTVPTEVRNSTTYNGFTSTQTYTYDSLNRIKDAKEMIGTNQQWKQTFLYDRYGNRRFDTANNNTTTLPTNCVVAVCNPTIDSNTNKLIGYQFDSSGNTKVDANGQTFIYDAENKQVEVRNASNGIVGQYFYDGDGKRIKKVVPSTSETTIFVYDASGKMVAEYSTAIASQQDAKVSYLTSDHLGSPRINTDANGQVIARHDYQPFGEEISRASYGIDSVRKKFTSYEKDTETNLDFAQARYFNSGLGRFSSPDYFANDTHAIDPQSWNLYVYTRNNPLNATDPSGKDIFIQVGFTTFKYTFCNGGGVLVDSDGYLYEGNDRVVLFALNTLNNMYRGGSRQEITNLTEEGNHLFNVNETNSENSNLDGSTFGSLGNNSISTSQVNIDLSNENSTDESTTAFGVEILSANYIQESDNLFVQQAANERYPDIAGQQWNHALNKPQLTTYQQARESFHHTLAGGNVNSASPPKQTNTEAPSTGRTAAGGVGLGNCPPKRSVVEQEEKEDNEIKVKKRQ
jgi:RHS repeat-associated protein